MNPSSIHYISRSEIDVQKWDNCISNARNGLIYAFSFYLDAMSRNWDALVMGDYKIVMPLTWNKKAGIFYLYQPPLTPSLGIFGDAINANIVNAFIESIPQKFRFMEISLNTGNDVGEIADGSIESIKRKNYILRLRSPYQEIYDHYNENIKRNIKRAVALGCVAQRNIAVEQIIMLVKDQFSSIIPLQKNLFVNFHSLYNLLSSQGKATTYGITHNGELLSGAVYFYSHSRAFYILVGNHPNGKTIGTSHYLVDRFIADHAGQDLVLDFEGSDISSLAFFYRSFGATEESYHSIKMNRLPWYAKWMK